MTSGKVARVHGVKGGVSRRVVLQAGGVLTAAMAAGVPLAARAEGGGTLVWGMPTETDILDPHATGGWLTYDVTYQMFEGLVKEDLTQADAATPELVPGLAKAWTVSDDGTEYLFQIREGVKFHDGTPFDAAAAKFNFERFWDEKSPNFFPKAKGFVSNYTRWIKSVEVIDPMTIKVMLTAPNYDWIRSGLQSYGQPLMVSPTAVKKSGNEGFALNPVGTGPFKFVERVQGEKTVLERNDDYWGTKAKLDRIIVRPLTDPAALSNALRAGEVNMVIWPSPDDIQSLADEGFKLNINENVPSLLYIFLNTKNKYMSDPRVRRAINFAIDREGIAREIDRNTGRPANGMLSPGTFAFDPNFKMYDYDPEKAKALLAEAGYPNGFTMKYLFSTGGTGDLRESWIQRDLKKVGIEVEIIKAEWISFLHDWAKGLDPEIGMSEIAWGMTIPSWTGLVTRTDTQPPNGLNSGWYSNPKVDELLQKALQTADQAEAAKLYREANRIIMDDAAYVPVVTDMMPILTAPNVKGLVIPAEVWVDLSTVWVES